VDDSFPIPTTFLLNKGLFTAKELENEEDEAIRNVPS